MLGISVKNDMHSVIAETHFFDWIYHNWQVMMYIKEDFTHNEI